MQRDGRGTPPRGAVAGRRRGLGDVLHYFISEEEQRDARQRKAPDRARTPARWALVADPLRPLDRSLTRDLACALLEAEGGLRVLAPFGPPVAQEPGSEWARIDLPPHNGAAVLGGIGDAMRGCLSPGLLAALPPSWIARLVASDAGDRLTSVLLPVEAAPWGLEVGISRIRRLEEVGAERIGVFLVGGGNGDGDSPILHEIERAAPAGRERRVDALGGVIRDQASFRALLLEVSVLRLEPESRSASSLRALARRIVDAGHRESGASS